MTSTPTATLVILLSLEPIRTYVKREAESPAARLYLRGHWGGKTGHAGMSSRQRFAELEAILRFDEGFEVILPEKTEWENGMTPVDGDIRLLTDGSKAAEGMGAGVYREELHLRVALRERRT